MGTYGKTVSTPRLTVDTLVTSRTTLAAAPGADPFARNGYALMPDLETPKLVNTLREMETFQARYLAATRGMWKDGYSHTGDRLDNWSRRWEYPYIAHNLKDLTPGRVLDAGSGITFFPYMLASQGWDVSCADIDPTLTPLFHGANQRLNARVDYRLGPIAQLPWADGHFDAIYCVSVLEHAPTRVQAMKEFARVLSPGGRLTLTWDVSLSRDCDVRLEDVAVILSQLEEHFMPKYHVDLYRPDTLLTTERMLDNQKWRLSWRKHPNKLREFFSWLKNGDPYHALSVMGTTWTKR